MNVSTMHETLFRLVRWQIIIKTIEKSNSILRKFFPTILTWNRIKATVKLIYSQARESSMSAVA